MNLSQKEKRQLEPNPFVVFTQSIVHALLRFFGREQESFTPDKLTNMEIDQNLR